MTSPPNQVWKKCNFLERSPPELNVDFKSVFQVVETYFQSVQDSSPFPRDTTDTGSGHQQAGEGGSFTELVCGGLKLSQVFWSKPRAITQLFLSHSELCEASSHLLPLRLVRRL